MSSSQPFQHEIRIASMADVDGIQRCVEAAYNHYIARIGSKPGPMLDDYGELVGHQHVFVVDADDGIGAVLVLICKPDALLLDNVAVAPALQGVGVGKRLMLLAEDEARRLGYGRIILYTHELMVENIAIYEHLGYAEFERRHERGLARVYLGKDL